jgi:hypothetical protein
VTTGSARPPDALVDPTRARAPEWMRHLAVDADLDLAVDTAAGEHCGGRLTGHGHRLRLEFDRPELLVETADRSTVRAVVAQLIRARLRAELYGPGGRIAVVDPAHESRLAALLLGSAHIRMDRRGWALAARAVTPTATTMVAVGVVAAAAALLAGALVIGRRR